MTRTYTVIAEGQAACDKHPPLSDEQVTILTNDIEFRGKVTNSTDNSISVRGNRRVVKRIRGKYKDLTVPFVLHFKREDIIDPRKGSFTGASVIS